MRSPEPAHPRTRPSWGFSLFALALVWTCGGCARDAAPVIDASPTSVAVRGVDAHARTSFADLPPDRRQSVLQVRVADASPDVPALLGDVTLQGREIVFTPRYPFRPGLSYRVCYDPAALGETRPPQVTDFTLPAPPALPPASVVAVYPSANALPENLLKFYIQFSAPMSRGAAYRNLRLTDDRGQVVAAPFLELGEELWDPAMTRFTLFFDPGRLKHGLVPRMELGPALVAGRSYTLTIDAAWPDGEGHPLVKSYTKTFRTLPADQRQPDPRRWRITPPLAGSTRPLTIDFDEPLDAAMLRHVISVSTDREQPIAGRVTVGAGERQWLLTPDAPWQGGRYVLAIDTDLEDLAGNSIGRPFEVDLNERPSPAGPSTVKIPFEIRP